MSKNESQNTAMLGQKTYWLDKKIALTALRVTVSIMLSWVISMRLNVPPNTAMMSAAIIALMPSSGDFISKLVSRMIGTAIGCILVVTIAPFFISDANVFIFILIFILSLCSFLSTVANGYMAYMWAVVGLTIAIISFPALNNLSEFQIFSLAQSRGSAIFISIICCEMAIVIFPHESTGKHLEGLISGKTDEIRAFILSSVTDSSTGGTAAFFKSYAKSLKAYVDLKKVMALDPFFDKKQTEDYSFFDLIDLVFDSALLYRLCRNKDIDMSLFTDDFIEQVNNIDHDRPFSLKFIQPLKIQQTSQNWRLLLNQIELILNQYYELVNGNSVKRSNTIDRLPTFEPGSFVKGLNNGIRTLFVLLTLFAFVIGTNWDYGFNALLNASILAVMLPTIPMPASYTIILQAKGTLYVILLGFVTQYFLMPQIDSPLVIFILFSSYMYIASYVFFKDPKLKIIMMFFLFFWTSYISVNNIPSYDFLKYLNVVMSTFVGMFVPLVFFSLIKPSSPIYIETRAIKAAERKIIRCINDDNSALERGILFAYLPYIDMDGEFSPELKKVIFLNELVRTSDKLLILQPDDDLGVQFKKWIKMYKNSDYIELQSVVREFSKQEMIRYEAKSEENIELLLGWYWLNSATDFLTEPASLDATADD
ncbi:FUSC family protein [Shewanella gelidimarina]|uniref:FUSC family protein n=1 Tax=Shewanella gelidimarina TaxID=56813 RepID=UPI00200E8121|nr:FUSC family protein [Shewanella gelidimarina]MCL1057794.1 FUSC family protein [Shewanella gelidimarina]